LAPHLVLPAFAAGLRSHRRWQAGAAAGGVYRGLPRTDLRRRRRGPPHGLCVRRLGRLSPMDTQAMVMGDPVLMQDEVALVMQAE
jgi:hypothetical protein